jgi:hypothetical protein
MSRAPAPASELAKWKLFGHVAASADGIAAPEWVPERQEV